MGIVIDSDHRTVRVALSGYEPILEEWSDHYLFRPTFAEVQLLDGAFRSVVVVGPRQTAKGRDHASQQGRWRSWAGNNWPPDDAPQAALDVVDAVTKTFGVVRRP